MQRMRQKKKNLSSKLMKVNNKDEMKDIKTIKTTKMRWNKKINDKKTIKISETKAAFVKRYTKLTTI